MIENQRLCLLVFDSEIEVILEWIPIAIADNGQGMDEKVQEKISDHLFTTKGVGKGTGLGLAIALPSAFLVTLFWVRVQNL